MIILIWLVIGCIVLLTVGSWAKADNEKMYQRFYKEAQARRIQERENLRKYGNITGTPVDR